MLQTAEHSIASRRTSGVAMRAFILSALVGVMIALPAQAQQRLYRYLNEEGVTVINDKIPPEYVKKGYEVVTLSGKVLEVIPPAPTGAEAEAASAQYELDKQLAEWDAYLLRRYSTPDDIRAAKKRKVRDFEASLSILRGNANTIQTQIELVQSRAASFERQGRAVPEATLNNLAQLQEELSETNRLIAIREENQRELVEKFDKDIERFKVIRPETAKAE